MTRYMLDTNTFSMMVRGHAAVTKAAHAAPAGSMCVSCLTEGELYYGLARRPDLKDMARSVTELLLHLDVLPWTSATAQSYGLLRAEIERQGKRLAALDLLIAAHAVESQAILVTSDKAFRQIAGLALEDWTALRP